MRNPARTGIGTFDTLPGRQHTDLSFRKGANRLVYLIHGVTGTPVEMGYLGRYLSQQHRWDVYATTLPGHCTTLRNLVRTTQAEWRSHVQSQLSALRQQYEHLYVVGLSAGALLALEASTVVEVDGVGVLSPTFQYDGWNTPWSHTLLPWAMKIVPLPLQQFVFHLDGPPYGIKDKQLQASVRKSYRPRVILREWIEERWGRRKAGLAAMSFSPAASKGYPIFPLRTLTEIDGLMTYARTALQNVTAPTVILQAREDDMTGPRNASIVFEGISSQEKQLVLLDDCYHVITVDKQREAVAKHVASFFQLHTKEATTPRQIRSAPPH
ncbi:MAG: alpha/beta hydrolase [Nitrospirales bacterium]